MSDVVNFAELAAQGAELLPPRILLQVSTIARLLEVNSPALGDSLGKPPEAPTPPSNNTVLVGALDF